MIDNLVTPQITPPVKPILTHEQWEAEWYRLFNMYLNNDPGRHIQGAREWANKLMIMRYGEEPEAPKVEGGDGLIHTVGSVITAPFKAIGSVTKIAFKGATVVGLIKVLFTMKNFNFTLTSVVTAVVAGVIAFAAAYKLALPDGVSLTEWVEVATATITAIVAAFKRTTNPSEIK
jgi:hypothetical protein